MVFADPGPMRFGQDHAHQVVRLRVLRGDAHRIAGVPLGVRQIALLHQQQRQFVGCPDRVRVDRYDAPHQGFGGGTLALGLADLVQHPEHVDPARRVFEHLQGEGESVVAVAAAMRAKAAVGQCRHRRIRRRHAAL